MTQEHLVGKWITLKDELQVKGDKNKQEDIESECVKASGLK